MITKVKKLSGERWDEAFFRELIAPELLRQPVSEDGDVDDSKFENILLKTLKPTATALVDIANASASLADVENALHAVRTVESRAEAVVVANGAYQDAIQSFKENAGVIHNLAVRSPLPGVPTIQAGALWLKEKALVGILHDMVIDKEHGILITEPGLGKLLNVQDAEINRIVGSSKRILCMNEVIDFRHLLQQPEPAKPLSDTPQEESEGKDFDSAVKIDHKPKKERRAVSGFNLETALEIVSLFGSRTNVSPVLSEDLLGQAFGIAAEIDTNPYRREAAQILAKRSVLKKDEQIFYKQDIKLGEE